MESGKFNKKNAEVAEETMAENFILLDAQDDCFNGGGYGRQSKDMGSDKSTKDSDLDLVPAKSTVQEEVHHPRWTTVGK